MKQNFKFKTSALLKSYHETRIGYLMIFIDCALLNRSTQKEKDFCCGIYLHKPVQCVYTVVQRVYNMVQRVYKLPYFSVNLQSWLAKPTNPTPRNVVIQSR